ncbi:hypothetical protein [Salisediminibacterium halotolerans]|uniref:Uncharacterized protein n=1 Tax=Salisediminibacterium halotolerans TaxID=517425 RepID=A0A1H9RQ74_9BACI|nr:MULTISPECIES: hypothetical protein [Salisediminibacterium]RLJ81039.1 hypothetical protein BCL39_0100 [Actinophytocola xinjiangensis]RPE87871.1 hypothetical protein EDD67_1611 [Salisediminibacterium halotolerans]TWG37932.1 hypothetical protein BCL52_0100 [Salisediminibacterium halotolerans]SER74774.1 hypothetical protein SAMN05444126_10547 [Salisediminibacterium haloalkalitolerans]GEL08243.1 hypothetical protein SHA02_16590 [Salisediminibacterium halotolerans]
MFKKIFGKSCAICGKKTRETTVYLNERDETVHVCFQCVPQAERKALRRKPR